MDITQSFYDKMASQYDKLFLDWHATTQEQAAILNTILLNNGFDKTAQILDCACGIGTQAIGLAEAGYCVTASDISDGELAEAAERAEKYGVKIRFERANFCALSDTFSQQFDVVIAMDNALPHMLTRQAIHKTDKGQRVSFQTWVWNEDNYQLTQYIIDDEDSLQASKFVCEYRAVRREELTNLLLSGGCSEVVWKFPEKTGFYQPIVIARK